jgi:hypothetical protein
MTLSDLALISSILSSGGTFISLIYLGIQVQDAKKNQEASIRQARTDRVCTMNMKVTEPPLAAAVLKGFTAIADMSDIELQQFRFFCRAAFFSFEDSFFQHQERVLSKPAFETVVTSIRDLCTAPGMRVQWQIQRGAFNRDFAIFMDTLIASVEAAPQMNSMAQWTAILALRGSTKPQQANPERFISCAKSG